jgi:HD-GYP domain-containing protein (c-di-GMP phosphodiesterase class II)
MSTPATPAPRNVVLLDVADLLAPGQPLPFNVLDATGRLLLATGQVIADGRQLDALFERGASVSEDEVQTVRAERASVEAQQRLAAIREPTHFDRWERHLWALDSLLRALGRDVGQAAQVHAVLDRHLALVDHHPDAALYLCVRQDDRRFALYGLAHALHTATVVQLSARVLGWPADQVRLAVGAALTMNASIVELQARLAEQTEAPTRRQLDEIRQHPLDAVALLKASGVTDATWLQAVAQHHEQVGGGGYPQRVALPGEIPRLLRAADVLLAKISPRAARAPMLPQLAARQLFQEESGSPLAAALIKAVGIYPPGDFVRLRNGELAVVSRRATGQQAAQAVALVDTKGRPVSESPQRDTAQADFAIASPISDRRGLPRVLPEQVYGLLPPID